jgi:hypothetical protein
MGLKTELYIESTPAVLKMHLIQIIPSLIVYLIISVTFIIRKILVNYFNVALAWLKRKWA